MKYLFLILCFFADHFCNAQGILQGVVKEESGAPVAGASVFLNNTSTGTVTAADGSFGLRVPAGRHDLVVSAIGFQTHTQVVESTGLPPSLLVQLKPRVHEMDEVVIEPYEKDGWRRWGRFFLENFIGTSDFAASCVLKNPEVLRFRFRKEEGRLLVSAMEPLIIENKALGYHLKYQLEAFSFEHGTRYLALTGYPFFEPMEGNDRQQRKWAEARAEAYYGSQMHFMRSVFRNRILEEGFEVRTMERFPHLEKLRVKKLYAARSFVSVGGYREYAENPDFSPDSTAYYQRVLKEPDWKEKIHPAILPGDSIAFAVNSTTAGLEFEHYLLVIYTKKKLPRAYRQRYPDSGDAMASMITLVNGRPIEIEANGSYYHPMDLLNMGYWSWSEKIATMLPFDYKPSKP